MTGLELRGTEGSRPTSNAESMKASSSPEHGLLGLEAGIVRQL